MIFSEVQVFLRGIGWIALFLLPLLFSKMSSETDYHRAHTCMWLSIGFQAFLVVVIGHSWVR